MAGAVITSRSQRQLGATSARLAFGVETGVAGDDLAEQLGQLLAGLREEAREVAGSDALWGEAVAVMRRVIEERS